MNNSNSDIKDQSTSWPHILFVEYPFAYLPILEAQKKFSGKEVDGLTQLFEENNVKKESKVLDFSCGIGRHSIELAKRGYEVVGYDPSSFYLDRARKDANDELNKNKPRFYQGDPYCPYKQLAEYNEVGFDAIIIMENSIGYLGRTNDISTLTQLSKVANDNCILVMETENRDWRICNFEPITSSHFDKMVIYEHWRFNFERSETESLSMFYEKTDPQGKVLNLLLRLQTFLRLYSLHELINMLDESGWKYLKGYHSITQLDPITMDSSKIITVGKI